MGWSLSGFAYGQNLWFKTYSRRALGSLGVALVKEFVRSFETLFVKVIIHVPACLSIAVVLEFLDPGGIHLKFFNEGCLSLPHLGSQAVLLDPLDVFYFYFPHINVVAIEFHVRNTGPDFVGPFDVLGLDLAEILVQSVGVLNQHLSDRILIGGKSLLDGFQLLPQFLVFCCEI